MAGKKERKNRQVTSNYLHPFKVSEELVTERCNSVTLPSVVRYRKEDVENVTEETKSEQITNEKTPQDASDIGPGGCTNPHPQNQLRNFFFLRDLKSH